MKRMEPMDATTGVAPRTPGLVRWIDRISTVLAIAAGVAAMAMMINIVADVISRTAARPLPGTLDITQFAWMPIVVSLGMGYALLQGQHIRIGLLADLTSRRTQQIIEVVAMVASLVALSALSWFGAERAFRALEVGEFSSATPWLPIGVFRWVMVAGLIGLALQAIAQLLRAITDPDSLLDDEFALIESEIPTPIVVGNTEGERA